jgi:hypothetical protein
LTPVFKNDQFKDLAKLRLAHCRGKDSNLIKLEELLIPEQLGKLSKTKRKSQIKQGMLRASESRSSYQERTSLADVVEEPAKGGRATSVFELLENPHKHIPEVVFTTGSTAVEAKPKKRTLVNTFFSSIFGGGSEARYTE